MEKWNYLDIHHWFWITVIGLTALAAHFCMTKAMQLAEVSLIVTIDFLLLPLIAVVGILFYNEGFDLALLIGGSLMLAGNLLNIFQPDKLGKENILS